MTTSWWRASTSGRWSQRHRAGRRPSDRSCCPVALCDFASRGGRVVVLATREWDWTDLCDASIPESGVFSRALPHEEVEHPLLAGVEAEWLKRWDGRPGTVSVAGIAGRAVEAGELVLWAVEPARSVVAQLPAASGDGMLLFCQLDLQSHIAQGSARCDPVAERILLNLLAW